MPRKGVTKTYNRNNMSTLIETITYRNHPIEIHRDESAYSPGEWGNEDLFLIYDHRDFCVKVDGYDPEEVFEALREGKKLFKGYYFFPVYAYIHSGVALSLGRSGYPFNDQWDTSFRGFALVKRQTGWWTSEQAYKAAESLIEEWNQYLSGDVYGYVAGDDSCWGYYGKEGKEQMINEARSGIDAEIKMNIKNHLQQLKAWIINKVSFDKRKPLTI